MTGFVVAATLLAALALAFLLPPLLRSRTQDAAPQQRETNAGIYREQLAELEADHAKGALDAHGLAAARRELERRIVAEADAGSSAAAAPAKRPRAAALVVALLVPLVASLGYWQLGNPGALTASPPGTMARLSPEQVRELTEKLWERMHASPEDPKGWLLLGRSLSALGDVERAAKAYSKAAELLPKDPNALADYAEALAMSRGMKLEGEPRTLALRALELDPEHLKALALAGSAEFDRGAFAEASTYWARALKQLPPDSELAKTITASIEEAKRQATPAQAGPAPGSLQGVVTLDPALAAKADPGDTVFVLARPASGSRMPLAVARTTVRDLPYSFKLDDSMAMAPGAQISGQSQVVVVARVSKSGKAAPAKGDIEGVSKPVAPGASGVAVVMSRVLD